MGSWTHKPEKRQAMKEDRQAARRTLAAETDELVTRTDGGRMTMHEMYGDGSSHEVCQACGMCSHCGDCNCTPSGEPPNVRANAPAAAQERHDG